MRFLSAKVKSGVGRATSALWAILLLAALWRGYHVLTGYYFFNSDEAIVALMARHMLAGEPIPIFFYGQNYMGSLGAMLVALGFAVFGQSVETLRLVQGLLFLAGVGTGYLLARRVTGRPRVALITAALMAFPVPMASAYTSMALGGYNELVILGNLIGLLGWVVTVEGSRRWRDWALLGGLMGVGWWSHAGVITPIAVVGVMGLACFRFDLWRLYLLAGLAFMVGSALWWVYNLQNDWFALTSMVESGDANTAQLFSNLTTTPFFSLRDVYLLVIAASGLYGFRVQNEGVFVNGVYVWLAGGVYVVLATVTLARWRAGRRPTPKEQLQVWPGAPLFTPARWIALHFAVLTLIFIITSIFDVTGRYLLPIWMPASLGVALAISHLSHRGVGAALLIILLTFHTLTTLHDFRRQHDISQRQARNDEALTAWLEAENLRYGYAPFWDSFRLSFLTEERLRFDSSLPVDEQGKVFNRYPPYTEQVAAAGGQFWLTRDNACLDAAIAHLLDDARITYQVQTIGNYRILYDLSGTVSPGDFELDTRPLNEFPFYPALKEVCP